MNVKAGNAVASERENVIDMDIEASGAKLLRACVDSLYRYVICPPWRLL